MVRYVLLILFFVLAVSPPIIAKEPFVERVLVLKSKRELHLIHDGKIFKSYDIGLGQQPLGHKTQQGDSRTPEGHYVIDYRNPKSKFTLSMHINYPKKNDIKQARAKGVSPGGDIFIHGLPTGMKDIGSLFRKNDWTDGCIAVSNKNIRELWYLVENGTPIEIRP